MKATITTVVLAVLIAAGVAYAIADRPASPTFGALAGPDIASPYLNWGGIAEYRASATMKAASSVLCAVQSPAATSTLLWAGWQITTGTTTSATIDLATSTTATATTTNLVAGTSVSSGAQKSVSWASSGTNGITAPNTWIVVKTTGATAYTFGGKCDAAFAVL